MAWNIAVAGGQAVEWLRRGEAAVPSPIDTYPPLPYTGALDPYVSQGMLSAMST